MTVIRRDLPGSGMARHVQRRLRGEYDIDEWGLDPELVSTTNPVFALRWDIEVQGAEWLPTVGGAVLVFNRWSGISEPWVLARGIRQSSGRFVRTVGVPDIDGIGPFLRRFGAVLDHPDEIAGLLRAGQVVGLPTGRDLRSRGVVGSLDVRRIEPALVTGSPVVPVALAGRELGRTWRVVIGPPVEPERRGGPLGAVELAEVTRAVVQDLLAEALPPRWF